MTAWASPPKRAYYALKGLSCLARASRPLRAGEIAACADIPPAQAAKILYQLTWAGFVSSRRGSRGGFWLRRRAQEIRLIDVLNFFHPPPDDEEKHPGDPVLRLWQKTAAASHQHFRELTVADLIMDAKAAEPFAALLRSDSNWPACP